MVKLNKIYTRTGDDGSTGLVDGGRAGKDSARIHAIGEVDEANSAIGLAIALLGADDAHVATLRRIQNDLFDLGADIATPAASDEDDFAPGEMTLRIIASQTAWLEGRIDAVNDGLEPLRSFILPGGSAGASALHVARAVSRRAERALVAAGREERINPEARRYLNRLSDYLFVLTRAVNAAGQGDILWVPGGSRG